MKKELSTHESMNPTTGEIQNWKVDFIWNTRLKMKAKQFVQFTLVGEDFEETTRAYYASTIADGKGGLDLIGYADWAKISATTMDKFRKVIQQELKGI